MRFSRRLRYWYWRFVRLRGSPQELALGMALGVFAGCMPILPFQSALGLALAVPFRASKITALIGTWVSNPLNWYFLYLYAYKIGAWVLGISGQNGAFRTIMEMIRKAEDPMLIASKIMGAGSGMLGSFLLGGLIIGIAFSVPSYFVFLRLFQSIQKMRRLRRERRAARALEQ